MSVLTVPWRTMPTGNSTYVSQRSAAKPSSYQMFVKQMTLQLQQAHPENKQVLPPSPPSARARR
eukprot:3189655-Rhodomonas_salina.3